MSIPEDFPLREIRVLLKKIPIYPDDGAIDIVTRINKILQTEINRGHIRRTISVTAEEEETVVSFLYLRETKAAKHNMSADEVRRLRNEP